MQTCHPFFSLFLLDFTLIKTDSLSIRSNHHWCFCPHWKWPFYEFNVVSHTHRKHHKLVHLAVTEGSLVWRSVLLFSQSSQGKTTLNKPKQAHLQWYGLCFMNASDEGIQQSEFKSLQRKRSSVDSGIKDLQDGDYSRPQDSQLKFLKRWQRCLLSWIMRIDVPLCSVCRLCPYTPLHSSLLTLQTSAVSTSMSTHILHPLLLQSSQKRTALHSEHISITTVYFT